ncbi:CPBP family intramembrane glutamic endopeptidase [Asticcacaulis taihuensis]|uniref:CAAX prenyl protease 2/Lysostaphin resistance protein A-like domain-containing protein n=1 Tax=Asticcacaulis taihuensis TaxID=260084 RepID=A0A1G4TWH9_9CAUL|nr:type II CAAX endopeptidase family protein [Asticcacaulis taihuensis]SCW84939.1 hypothetical protein SAMN02927928_0192 [Asticcacaulis taihuensis]
MAGIELYAPRTERHRRTWTAFAIPLSVIFIILGMMPGAFIGLINHIPLIPGTSWIGDVYQLLIFGPIIGIFLLWAWLFERRGPQTLGFNSDFVKRYLRGLAIGLGFLATVVGSIWLLGGYQFESLGFWRAPSLMTFVPLVALFLGFMVQGATEETAMRGYLLQVIASRHGIYWGIAVNMIVFSLLHAGNIKPSPELAVGLLNIVLVAIFLSFYAIREGSLWGVCAWHTAWNWLLGVGFGLEVSGEKLAAAPIVVDLMGKPGAAWWLTGASFGPEGSLVTSVVLGAAIAWQVSKGALKQGEGYPAPQKLAETAV